MVLTRTLLYALLLSLVVGCVSTTESEDDEHDDDYDSVSGATSTTTNTSTTTTNTGTTNTGTTNTGTTNTSFSLTTTSTTSTTTGWALNVANTCNGSSLSPQLSWANPPAGTNAYIIIVDEPATSTVHWSIYKLISTTTSLAEGASNSAMPTPTLTVEGLNDFGVQSYSAPCPTDGLAHTYKVTIFAFNNHPTTINETIDVYTSAELQAAFSATILGQAEMTFTYQ